MNCSPMKDTPQVQNKIQATQLQKIILSEALKNRYALAMWQLPNETVQHCILDFSGKPHRIRVDLEECVPGFVVSPFVSSDKENAFFVRADFQIDFQEGQCLHQETADPRSGEFYQNLLKQPFENLYFARDWRRYFKKSIHHTSTTQSHYENLVKKGIEEIQNGRFIKVVLSRTKSLEYKESLDLIDFFQKLSENYSTAFRYLFHIPEVGTWMGASPEILISADQNQIFRTVALAGTQALQAHKKLSEVAWTQKEIEEQAMVGRYIINCFKKIRLREFDEEGPKTIIAGNLMHLCTRFLVDMQAANFPQLGTVMLDLLHPTSAVCGMPKDPALDFILKHEGHDREFYSGFLGPVNIHRESHIFVNLRCMQFLEDQMLLYAGAGITEDSNPTKEWNETEMKCETLNRVLTTL